LRGTGWGFPEAVRGRGWLMEDGGGGRCVGFHEKKLKVVADWSLGQLT
jgi:hypothetical protein